MSSLYPSLLNNQPAEEMEMQDYPNSGRFRLSLKVSASHRPCHWPWPPYRPLPTHRPLTNDPPRHHRPHPPNAGQLLTHWPRQIALIKCICVHCVCNVACLRMHHRPSARTLQHVTAPIRNIYRFLWLLLCYFHSFNIQTAFERHISFTFIKLSFMLIEHMKSKSKLK